MKKRELTQCRRAETTMGYFRDIVFRCDDGSEVIVPKETEVDAAYWFEVANFDETESYPADTLRLHMELRREEWKLNTTVVIDHSMLLNAFSQVPVSNFATHTTVFELWPKEWRRQFQDGIILDGYHHVADTRGRGHINVYFGESDERCETFKVHFHHHSLKIAISFLQGQPDDPLLNARMRGMFIRAQDFSIMREPCLDEEDIKEFAEWDDFEKDFNKDLLLHQGSYNLVAPLPNLYGLFSMETLDGHIFAKKNET